jgi:uncharacterized protein YjiS (DUF1127 family)
MFWNRKQKMDTIDTILSSGRFHRSGLPTASAVRRPFNGNVLSRLARRFEVWSERRRSRAVLARLTDRELADIGISRGQADFEASRPFWESSSDQRR